MDKKLLIFSIIVSLVILVGGNCFAENDGNKFKASDIEVTISGSVSKYDLVGDIDATMFSFAGSWGYFFSGVTELSLKGSVSKADVEVADMTMYGIGMDMKFFIPTPDLQPYLGMQIMYLAGDVDIDSIGSADTDGSMYGPMIGFKYFLTSSTLFNVELQYNMYNGDDIEEVVDNSLDFLCGFSYRF